MKSEICDRRLRVIVIAITLLLVGGGSLAGCGEPTNESGTSDDAQATAPAEDTSTPAPTETATPQATSTSATSPTTTISASPLYEIRTNMGGGMAYDDVAQTIDFVYWSDQPAALAPRDPFVTVHTTITTCVRAAQEPVLVIEHGGQQIRIAFKDLGKNEYEGTIDGASAGGLIMDLCSAAYLDKQAAMTMEWTCPDAPGMTQSRPVGTLRCSGHPLADDPSGVIGRPTGGGVCDSAYSGDSVYLYEVRNANGSPYPAVPGQPNGCPYMKPANGWPLWTPGQPVLPTGVSLATVPAIINGTPNPDLVPPVNPVTIGAAFAPPTPNYGWTKAPAKKCYVLVAVLSSGGVSCTYSSPIFGVSTDAAGVTIPVTDMDVRVRMENPCMLPVSTCN